MGGRRDPAAHDPLRTADVISPSTVRAAVAGALVGALAVAGMVGSAYSEPAPEAQGANRAAVVVDTGSGVVARCITFSSDSVSGLQALELAGVAPVVRAFSGQGGAVCGLNGVGCPADSSCLTCQAPNYWAYHRADAGAGGFTYSSAGAGSTSVTNGDVEGWRWGTGAAPGFRSFASVCPLQPPPTTTTSTTRPPSNGGRPGGGPAGNPDNGGTGSTGGVTGGAPGAPGGSAEPGSSATTVAPTTTQAGEGRPGGDEEGSGPSPGDGTDDPEALDGDETAARTPLEDGDGGGNARTWLAFAVLLGLFGAAGWRIRKLRSGSGA